ncbi:MAG: helix-turn-helix transcriptional regulator [Candidatus Latescibacterota bacterium]|nr:MAG: helix-turn-helix transcriptional regulator [Candidatus Latescibacterota bacterium]
MRELLDEKNFDEISVTEIAARANSSVGAFYARFEDKDGLLDYLGELFSEDMVSEIRRCESESGCQDLPLEQTVRQTIRILVETHRRHRGALRALVIRSLSTGASRPIQRARELAKPVPTLVEQIERRRAEINHPTPEIAVRLGLEMVASTVRDRILFPGLSVTASSSVPITDAVLAEELARAFLGFLGTDTD